MKGLLKTSGIIALIIIAGIITSIIITSNLNDRLGATYQRGYKEGHTQGYLIGFQSGGQAGYQEGSKIGYVKANMSDDGSSDEKGFYFVYEPTYDGLREILAKGKTGTVREVHDYAEINGIRTAYIRVQIARQAPEGMVYVYQLVGFETVDKGFIIIEPWSHQEVKLVAGQGYKELNGLPPSPYDDTITKITIVW